VIIIGIDPGTNSSGVVRYDTADKRVTLAHKALGADGVLQLIHNQAQAGHGHIAIERVQAQGQAGGDLFRTIELTGRLWQQAECSEIPYTLMYRRQVLRFLDVLGQHGNRDVLVRARLIEMFGGTRRSACGLKASPGPCYGVSSHAWSALAVALAVEDTLRVPS